MQVKQSKSPGPSNPPSKKLWKQIWKAPVNNRIRNFLWRAAKNILPTKANLRKKGISLDPVCSVCNKGMETVSHLFMECDFVKTALFSSRLSYRIPSDIDFIDWLLSILTCGDLFSTQLICTILYKTWLGRNQKLYQNKVTEPVRAAEDAVVSIGEFSKWNVLERGKSREITNHETNQKDADFIHVDASFSSEGFLAMGCVIKDHYSTVSVAACRREEIAVDVALGEALAVRWGLSLAKDLKLERIVVKSDAKTVVDCVNAIQKLAVLEPVIFDIRTLLSSFCCSSILFHSRCCNEEAHNLARLARSVGSRTWIGGYPSMVDYAVVADPVSS